MLKKEPVVFLLPFLYIITMILWVFLSELLFIHVPESMKTLIQLSTRAVIVMINGGILWIICQRFYHMFIKEKEINRTLLTIMNNVPEFIVLKDEKNKWMEANDFALSFTKQTRETFKGKNDQEIFQTKTACQQTDQKMWESHQIYKGEEILKNAQGKSVIFDVIKVPLFYKNGKKKGSIVIGRDISEKKAQEEVRKRTDKMHVVGALAAGIVHEIKNPLTTVQGFVQLLKEQTKEKRNENYYDIVLEEVKKIDFIIEQFLILSKTDNSNKMKEHNMNQLLKELSLLRNDEQIDANIKANLPSMMCDENQLKQALLNLLENAKEASGENEKISFHAWFDVKKNSLRFLISDKGKGISSKRLEKIGEPFFTTKEKGIGLGTTIAYKIIEQHKGRIWYESEVGKGTNVHIQLPCQS